jgi:hypothetical protein
MDETLSVVPVIHNAMNPPASASGIVAMIKNACLIERKAM